MLPSNMLAIHTSAHASQAEAKKFGGHVATYVEANGTTSQDDLVHARVVICTHEAWINEGLADDNRGIRYHVTGPRKNVFVDEFPDTVRTADLRPADFHALADELERFSASEQVAQIAREFATSLNGLCTDCTTRFDCVPALSSVQSEALAAFDHDHLNNNEKERNKRTWGAFQAARHGHAFVARTGWNSAEAKGQKRVVTYSDVFRSHPGLIILDATGDLEVRVGHTDIFKVHDAPRVKYPNLDITNLEMPDEFAKTGVTRMPSETATRYTRWIVDQVGRASPLDRSVLIVVHKAVEPGVRAELARVATSTDGPMVTHWGCDVGSNEYRECSSVFLFSEFHQPRHAYLAKWLGSVGQPADVAALRAATGQTPTGGIKAVQEAHLLRNFKQMACRGTARAVDEDGNAMPMRLFTSMDRKLLVRSLPDLFPGAPTPKYIASNNKRLACKGKRLANLLIVACQGGSRVGLTADEITAATGIASKDIKRAFQSRECEVMIGIGWEFVPGNGRKEKPRLEYLPVGTASEVLACAA